MLHAYCRSLLCQIIIKPTVIVYPLDHLPVANEKQQEMLDEIVQDVERYCGVERKHISFKDLWLESPPKEAAGQSLHDFLQDVSSPTKQITVPKDMNRQVKIRLFTNFPRTPSNSAVLTSKNITECLLRTRLLVGDGSRPLENIFHLINSSSDNREIGSGITLEQSKDAMQRMEIYKDWVLQKVLHVDDQTALIVLPIKDAEPNYRDTDPG